MGIWLSRKGTIIDHLHRIYRRHHFLVCRRQATTFHPIIRKCQDYQNSRTEVLVKHLHLTRANTANLRCDFRRSCQRMRIPMETRTCWTMAQVSKVLTRRYLSKGMPLTDLVLIFLKMNPESIKPPAMRLTELTSTRSKSLRKRSSCEGCPWAWPRPK